MPAGAAGQAAALPAGQAVRARRRDARRAPPTCASSPPPTATSRPTSQAGRFREDLLYRLNVIEIRVPALRERPEDILPLARRFLAFFARSVGRAGARAVAGGRRRCCSRYRWPGNVRELRNAIERAAILWPADRSSSPRPFPIASRSLFPVRPRVGGDFTLDEIEREHILRVIARTSTLEEAARDPRDRHVDAVAQAQALQKRSWRGAFSPRSLRPPAA